VGPVGIMHAGTWEFEVSSFFFSLCSWCFPSEPCFSAWVDKIRCALAKSSFLLFPPYITIFSFDDEAHR